MLIIISQESGDEYPESEVANLHSSSKGIMLFHEGVDLPDFMCSL